MLSNFCLNYTVEFLENLLNTPSPTGYTEEALALVETEFTALGIQVRRNNKGGLIATIPGENTDVERTISGHVDTLGAMVREIKSNGCLRLTQLGGYMWNAVEGEYCTVRTDDGREITGTIMTTMPSTHITKAGKDLPRTEENMEVRLDAVVSNADEVRKLGISVGDFVFLDPRCVVTTSGYIKSRHLDDKASVAVMVGAVKYLVDNRIKLPYTLNIFITNYEEVGHGASVGTPEKTVEFLAIDMGCIGGGLNGREDLVSICAKDSSGPYDYTFRKKLVEIAKANDIGYCVDIFPHYGSDASAALRAGANIKHALIGPGVHASHAHERTHRDGLMNTSKLLLNYLISK